MKNQIVSQPKKITLDDIKIAEDSLGFNLPETLKSFLMLYNGADFRNKWLYLRGYDLKQKETNVYVYIEDYITLEEYVKVWGFTKDILKEYNLFPVAGVEGGMLICVSISSSDGGKVYYYSYDFDEILICDSIWEFVDLLLENRPSV